MHRHVSAGAPDRQGKSNQFFLRKSGRLGGPETAENPRRVGRGVSFYTFARRPPARGGIPERGGAVVGSCRSHPETGRYGHTMIAPARQREAKKPPVRLDAPDGGPGDRRVGLRPDDARRDTRKGRRRQCGSWEKKTPVRVLASRTGAACDRGKAGRSCCNLNHRRHVVARMRSKPTSRVKKARHDPRGPRGHAGAGPTSLSEKPARPALGPPGRARQPARPGGASRGWAGGDRSGIASPRPG